MGNAREVERIHQPLYRHHVLGRVAFRGQVLCGQGQRDADHGVVKNDVARLLVMEFETDFLEGPDRGTLRALIRGAGITVEELCSFSSVSHRPI